MSPAGEPTLDEFLNRRVVLDTAGPLVFIGQLEAWNDRGYWLANADVHDCTDGHASKEEYVSVARTMDEQNVRHVNRRRVFVERRTIVCVSALDDVVTNDDSEEQGSWVP